MHTPTAATGTARPCGSAEAPRRPGGPARPGSSSGRARGAAAAGAQLGTAARPPPATPPRGRDRRGAGADPGSHPPPAGARPRVAPSAVHMSGGQDELNVLRGQNPRSLPLTSQKPRKLMTCSLRYR